MVETGASLPVVADVDVVLDDTFEQVDGDLNLEDFVAGNGAKVVVFVKVLRFGLLMLIAPRSGGSEPGRLWWS